MKMSTMSFDISNVGYHLGMQKSPLAQYFERHYLRWQIENGLASLEEFANFIGIKQPNLSAIMSGRRRGMRMETALRIAQRLGDFEILDILGYARPEPEELLAGFPAEIADPLLAAIAEARAELDARGITTGGDAAEEIVRAAFERHGVSVTFTRRGFED